MKTISLVRKSKKVLSTILLTWIFFFYLIINQSYSDIHHNQICLKNFQKIQVIAPTPHRDIHQLPLATQFELPPEAIERMNRHSISELTEKLDHGKNLIIELDPYSPNGDLIKGAYGESLQAQFVAKTLKTLLPEVEIRPKQKQIHPDSPHALPKKILRLYIRDSAEVSGVLNSFRTSEVMEMSILKPANPTFSNISRSEIREALGIQKNAKVVSFYIQSSDEVPNLRLMDQIVQQGLSHSKDAINPSIVFISFGGQMTRETHQSLFQNLAKTHEIKRLSEIKDFSLLDSKKPTAILNDTPGKMPYLNGSADLNFVYGPINLYEGLNSKTPLIFVSKIGNYNKATYEQMAEIAEATGGAKKISDLDQINPEMVKSLMQKSQSMVAPYEAIVHGKNPFNTYLNELKIWLEGEMSNNP